MFKCSQCGQSQPWDFGGWSCPACGGVFDLEPPIMWHDPTSHPLEGRLGMWRYRQTFPLPASSEAVTLGEGNTPLVSIKLADRTIYFKLEFMNPTGSYKDRGAAVLFTALRASGVRYAVDDSSGNAGAACAAYAARAGIQARVFVPALASGPKQAQIAAYGAEIIPIEGPRARATQAARESAAQGAYYASHVYNPLGLAGYATVAYEIWEQLGQAPDTIILPVGHGTLLLGLHLGFKALAAAGLVKRLPRLVGVQALACAPLWATFTGGQIGLSDRPNSVTLAEGLNIQHPPHGERVLAAIAESGGRLLAVDEDAIIAGRDALARLGFYVEFTSAVTWAALEHASGITTMILTGSGLKSGPP